MTISIYDGHYGQRQSQIFAQWAEHNNVIERRQGAIAASSAPVSSASTVYWAQRPVGQSETIRYLPSSAGSGTVASYKVRYGSAFVLPVLPVMGLHTPTYETFNTEAENIWAMFIANDRYYSQRFLQQDPNMNDIVLESVLNKSSHKASQHIIDNMGPDTIRRDKDGNIISREQWILDVNNNKFRQVVFYV